MARSAGQVVTRRRVCAALLLGPLLAACAPPRATQATAPDPLIALATAARSDAALAAAVIAATPSLAGHVGPLREARTQHAVALEAEVARQAGTATSPATPAPTPTAAAGATVEALRKAVGAAGDAAGQVAMTADVWRVGLVASVAACCRTYAAVLG